VKIILSELKGQRVLGHCAALAHLDLTDNEIEKGGADSLAGTLAGVLAQCPLTHLDLDRNILGAGGTESFAGVMGQCAALVHLDLCSAGSPRSLQQWDRRLRSREFCRSAW
jgi:hypothetical protein